MSFEALAAELRVQLVDQRDQLLVLVIDLGDPVSNSLRQTMRVICFLRIYRKTKPPISGRKSIARLCAGASSIVAVRS